MKKSYITKEFEKTINGYKEQKEELNRLFQGKLNELRKENQNASKEKRIHLENQIMPAIAAYESLQCVMSKQEAFYIIHSYVERRAVRSKKIFKLLMRIPNLYRRVPGIFGKHTPKFFGEKAGFQANEIQVDKNVWRIDMIKCPYHDMCISHGCPELCCCFCDSDDITYGDLDKNLLWQRFKTLGRGNDCCDFCLKRIDI